LKELRTLRSQQNIAVERTPDPLDDVMLASARDLAIWNLDKCFAQVRLVNAALERISDGSYDCCLQCDGEMGIKRLTALPHAIYCVGCQEQVEQQGKSFDPLEDGPAGKGQRFIPYVYTKSPRLITSQRRIL
jgi:RNA polymerase-binding transcription factor DksA